VAQEFAHVLLDHTSKYYSRKERDTDRVVEVRWGFAKEVKARKRHEEKRVLRILSQRETKQREEQNREGHRGEGEKQEKRETRQGEKRGKSKMSCSGITEKEYPRSSSVLRIDT
jgi:hypothetical protein